MRTGFRLILAAMLCAALGLAGCGRKGPLERPATAATAAADSGQVVQNPRLGRPFVLDRLLR